MAYIKVYSDELYHHGILGQKWGIRRYQNDDGSLTPEGRRKYLVNIDAAKLRVVNAQNAYENANFHNVTRLQNAYDLAKKDLEDEKIKMALNKEAEKGKKKSQHRLNLEKKYIEKGMTPEEAEIQAYKRVRTEKIIGITLGASVVAAAAVVAYKHYNKNVDKIIKAGMTMDNISVHNNKGVEDAFYAATDSIDKVKYRGLFGGGQLGGLNGKDIYKTTFKATNNIKMASEGSGIKVLKNLVNTNPEYKSELAQYLKSLSNDSTMPPNLHNLAKKGYKSFMSGKIDENVHNFVNTMLVDPTPIGVKMKNTFYNALKKYGYDAVIDINDKKNSGYNSVNPFIVFNGKGKAVVDSVKKLSVPELRRDNFVGRTIHGTEELTKFFSTFIPFVPAGAVIAGTSSNVRQNNDSKIVSAYRKEHPNTKLSYNEILNIKKDW